MTTRFWQPDDQAPDDLLTFVGCVASAQTLHVITEGPSFAPPSDPWTDRPEALWMHVTTASGTVLKTIGASGGGSDKRGRQMYFELDPPPEPFEPLTVTLLHEDGTTMWERQHTLGTSGAEQQKFV